MVLAAISAVLLSVSGLSRFAYICSPVLPPVLLCELILQSLNCNHPFICYEVFFFSSNIRSCTHKVSSTWRIKREMNRMMPMDFQQGQRNSMPPSYTKNDRQMRHDGSWRAVLSQGIAHWRLSNTNLSALKIYIPVTIDCTGYI